MDPAAPPAPLASFNEVIGWLRAHARADPGFGRVELLSQASGAARAAVVVRERARLGVAEAGRALPPEFDVLLVLGATEALLTALPRLPSHRVHVLPLPVPEALLQRTVEEGVRAAQTVLQGRVADQLIDVGLALNRERDPRRVLDLILRHARAITGADAGSVYVVEDEGQRLCFRVAHNDSVVADFGEFSLPVSAGSIVGACVQTGEVLNVADMREGPGGLLHDRSHDERLGYETRSMLTVPMRAPEGAIVGAVQLINAKLGRGPLEGPADIEARVHPFSEADARLVMALATQGAVALENANLYAEIQALFEGFVRASVTAIEQRDPTTSGHSQRVADLTVALAEVVDRSDAGQFRDIRFTPQELREIEYAGLLHDFGKVGVREQVLIKAKKLHDGQLERVLERFGHLQTATRLRWLERNLALGRPPDHTDAQAELRSEFAKIERWREVVLQANEPTILAEAVGEAVHEVAGVRFHDAGGRELALLEPDLLQALLVARGSLTRGERDEVESHVRHTYNFLRQIPWGRALARVPEIAGKHHEYLNGTGYPGHIGAPEIPIQARLMTVSDIFDALTASDRPYKKAVPIVKALDILGAEARAGKIDPEVLALFVEARVFERLGMKL
ncbi:MAG: GAF domain-containing protein [Myxococcales bacterium]|nr:GAF domain-containing protein [Myxococcales bacterium]